MQFRLNYIGQLDTSCPFRGLLAAVTPLSIDDSDTDELASSTSTFNHCSTWTITNDNVMRSFDRESNTRELDSCD
jgi:hypothetical protein